MALLLFALPALAPAAEARICRADSVPAASLMMPRLEIDLARCDDPSRPRTSLTITNVEAASAVAHVTLWTDWGVPLINFDLYLTGFDQVDLELEALFCDGLLPITGPGTSPVGDLSDPDPSLPICELVMPYDLPIPASLSDRIQKGFTGLDLGDGTCAGSPRGDGIARASLTVDLMQDCSLIFPSDAGYFDLARDENVLAGAAAVVDGSTRRALSVLHLEAQPLLDFTERSFYARYEAGDAGAREPLPSEVALTYQASDVAPRLRIWREVGRGSSPVACGTSPEGFPAAVEDLLIFDFEENPVLIPIAAGSEMIDVDLATLSGAPTEGWVFIEGRHAELSDVFSTDAVQTWATLEVGAAGDDRATATPAVLDTLCPELRMVRASQTPAPARPASARSAVTSTEVDR